MISKNEHPSADLPAVLDWRELARTSCAKIDWARVAQTALGSALLAGLVGGAMHVIGRVIEAEGRPDAQSADAAVPPVPDEHSTYGDDGEKRTDDPNSLDGAVETPAVEEWTDADDAAKLLGIDKNAGEDTIRAALRSHLSSSGLHPDQGGDGEQAKQLIAAKNLLIERARLRSDQRRTGAS